jgi:predicted ATPase/DNA-binding SARP family transcriptional activator
VEFRILGPLRILRDGEEVSIPAAQQRVILAVLLLAPNRHVRSDVLADALWPATPPPSARAILQNRISQLRRLVGGDDRLRSEPGGYVLRVAADELDRFRFEQLVEEGGAALQVGQLRQARRSLAEALALWRGAPLEDLPDTAFARAEIGRLADLRLAALENRIEVDLALGDHAAVVAELESLVEANPLSETLRGHLMLALYRSGRQSDALDRYRDFRRALVDGLGIDPTPRIQSLERAILNQDDAIAAPAPLTDSPRAYAPPPPPTPLVGRQAELEQLVQIVRRDDLRLVTATGPGGTGKTRLAIAVAESVASTFVDGVAFIPLAPIRDARLVAAAVAEPLGVQERSGRRLHDALFAHLRDRELLLILDNFEHVMAAAPFVSQLLAAAPTVKVLVTSRARLQLAAEHEFRVPALASADAVALFDVRARAVNPRWGNDQSSDAVDAICRQLDRLPLAIELAAARTKLLTPELMLRRLQPRLALLDSGSRDAPERHRTLRATIDWSYDLLDEAERDAFERFAVFAGGCTVESAEAVTGASLSTLASLLDKSLLLEHGGRVGLLETIREYALDRLETRDESEDTRRKHAEHFLELVEAAAGDLGGTLEPEALASLAREHDNVRAALEWALSTGQARIALRLVGGAGWFWFVRGHLSDGRRWTDAALALAEHERPAERAVALMRSGALAEAQGDYDAARGAYNAVWEIRAELGDEAGAASALNNLANLAYFERDYVLAGRLCEENLLTARRSDDEVGLASTLCNLGLVRLAERRPEEARRLLEESLFIANRLGDPHGQAMVHQSLGVALLEDGEAAAAAAMLADAVRLHVELDERAYLADTLEDIAGLALRSRSAVGAARLLGSAEALRREIGATPDGPQSDRRACTVAAVKDLLGASFAQTIEDGRSLSTGDAVAEALAETSAAIGA